MSVLLRPDFPEDPMSVWYLRPPMTHWLEIKTLDGRVLSRTHSAGDGKWRWITDVVSADAECDHIDVSEDSDESGDYITVKGKRYAQVGPLREKEDFSETEEHHKAMEEQEIFKAEAAAQIELARLRAKVAFLEHEVDTWKERYEAADEALEGTIRDFDKWLNEQVK
jgi:hypothetical protein